LVGAVAVDSDDIKIRVDSGDANKYAVVVIEAIAKNVWVEGGSGGGGVGGGEGG